MHQHGLLSCEVCGFTTLSEYGPAVRDIIEAHHLMPLSLSGETTTRLEDLALLCPNCHREAHASPDSDKIIQIGTTPLPVKGAP
jgi:5-methylcytosine-specific restriction protein A